MASIRKSDTGKLFFDFRYLNMRFREYSMLTDTKSNRAKMNSVLKKIEKEIKNNCFKYENYFPGSKNLKKIEALNSNMVNKEIKDIEDENPNDHPLFTDFAETWLSENEIEWRESHQKTQVDIINKRLLPVFGDKIVSNITKAEILAFRSTLAKDKGRKDVTLSPKRINSIMAPLRQIMNEAADRYEFNTPYRKIKQLKVPKTDVQPFRIEEVNKILMAVREDYKDYYTVRILTGMRTGEIDGLKWKYVDFESRLILIRETLVKGKESYTKNDSSQREIQMSELVFKALRNQYDKTGRLTKFVFCNKNGQPLDHNNITKRVWYPLLRLLNLEKRRPYQTRHTAATLWLASGENPEWIARQMGHVSTEMLFTVYSRFVKNLTRQDGSAFENLLYTKVNIETNVEKGEE